MKFRLLLLFPLLSLSSCARGFKPFNPNTHYDNVYLIMGQSNATGIAANAFLEMKDLETYQKYVNGFDQVSICYQVEERIEDNFVPVKLGQGAFDAFFGPEIGISEEISKVDEHPYIIKATYSGSCLQSDYMDKKGNIYHLYNRYVRFIKNELRKLKNYGNNPRLKGIFWMQGESDSYGDLCYTYKDAFTQFIDHLQKELYDYIYGYLNIVDAYISTKSVWPNPTMINEQKEAYSLLSEHNYCIKTNGEDESSIDLVLRSESGEDINDQAHYDSLSMLMLGKEAGKYLIK